MTYKGRQYGEKNEHKLMKAILAQMKSCNKKEKNTRNEGGKCVRGYRRKRW